MNSGIARISYLRNAIDIRDSLAFENQLIARIVKYVWQTFFEGYL